MRLMPWPAYHSGGSGLGRAAAGAERDQLLAAGLGDQREAVAADAGHLRLDHGEHGGGGDGRVDGVAALAQGFDGGQRGGGMGGRAHRPAPVHGRAPGEMEAAHSWLRKEVGRAEAQMEGAKT